MQKAYYLSTPYLARSRTPYDHYYCMRACTRACMCVCQNEGGCKREREREGGAIDVLLIHSTFVVAFSLFFFPFIYVQYTYSGFVTNSTSSAETRIEVSSG